MDRSDVLDLLTVTHTTDTSGTETDTITGVRTVYCFVSSVGIKESYAALAIGHNPEVRATLSEAADYQGEHFAVWRDNIYKILRVYNTGHGVELTLERTRDLEGLI